MNNALNAKLSKLIYALASDDPEYLSKAGAFDRLLLLVRELYRMLDETEGLKQLVFRLYYGKHYGLIKLDAASPNDDAGALRLKRWMVYSRIAERIESCRRQTSLKNLLLSITAICIKSEFKKKSKIILLLRRWLLCRFRVCVLFFLISNSLGCNEKMIY